MSYRPIYIYDEVQIFDPMRLSFYYKSSLLMKFFDILRAVYNKMQIHIT